MIRKKYLLILVIFISGIISCTSGTSSSMANNNLQWTRQVGGANGETNGRGVSNDGQGNVYLTGYTNVAISNQTLFGLYDYFIAKYNSDGLLLWTQEVGASGGDAISNGIITNTKGDSWVVGATNVGLSGQSQQGESDYFIAHYNESGLIIWSKQIGDSDGVTYGRAVSIDSLNNAYIVGYTNIGISGESQVGVYDYFIAKYSESGNLQWTRQLGSHNGYTFAYGVSTDKDGDSYVVGSTTAGLYGESQVGMVDYFVSKYDTTGQLQWVKQVGAANGQVSARGVTINGDIYIIGNTNASISGQTQQGKNDYFITKYDANGNLLWTKQIGAKNGITNGFGISHDLLGGIYVVGDTNVGINGQVETGANDYFITKYSSKGELLWSNQEGSASGISYGTAISTSYQGHSFVTGGTTIKLSDKSQSGVKDYFLSKWSNN